MMSNVLKVDKLTFGYDENRLILKEMSWQAESGELISILGRNGAGKSTLFKCILRLIKDYKGKIILNDTDMRSMSARTLAKTIAYIPQAHYPSFNYSVFDMVLMGSANQLSGIGSPGKKQEKSAETALRKVGILHLKDCGFGQISGGEQQLVLMARALLQNAGIWILDEPTASLDYGNQIRVLKQLEQLKNEGYLIIQSIHNPDQAYMYSDRIIAIDGGRILTDGSPKKVMNDELIKKLYGNDIEWKKL